MDLADADSAAEVLAYARAERATELQAAANQLAAAVGWADMHPAEALDVAAACSSYRDGCIPIAGEGAPLVAEFCIPEFALALGMSTDSGKRLIGQALELAYRLPKHWARIQAGQLPAWRARRLAEQTMSLSPEAAAWVDTQLAEFLHKTSLAAQDRLVAEAIVRFDPQRAQAEADAAEDRRHVRVDSDQVNSDGTIHIDADLDLPDALDFQAAITAEAAHLKDLGSTESLDVRRAKAAGVISRADLPLDLDATNAEDTEPTEPTDVAESTADMAEATAETTATTEPQPRKQRPRQMVLYVHLSAAALQVGSSDRLHLARIENTRSFLTAQQVRAWCNPGPGGPDIQIVVKPVIDLAEHIHHSAYEVSDRLEEQTDLRDRTCVFPFCTRAARKCDHDHGVPHNKDGPTCSCNIAPLCRRHHRLKTHAPWSYEHLEPGSYVWTSPHGYQYLVDHTGTLDVTPSDRRGRLLPPHAQQP